MHFEKLYFHGLMHAKVKELAWSGVSLVNDTSKLLLLSPMWAERSKGV